MKTVLTHSRRRLLSYRKQSITLQSKSKDWFLYDRGIRHERVNALLHVCIHPDTSLIMRENNRYLCMQISKENVFN